MSIKNSIKDGQGTNLEACVKETPPNENSLCVNISGISSQIALTTVPFASGGQVDMYLTKDGDGSTINASVEGTLGSPIEFRVNSQEGKDLVVTEISVIALDGAIKINNWIGSNGALVNGCVLSMKSNDEFSELGTFYKTLDLAAIASKGGFDLLSEQGGDMVKSIREYTPSIIIRAKDTFGTSASQQDYVSWLVQDSHSGIDEIRIQVRGFLAEPGEF